MDTDGVAVEDRNFSPQIAGPLGAGKKSYPEVCKSMEALTSGRLHHPNVVRTFRHCTILAHGEKVDAAMV